MPSCKDGQDDNDDDDDSNAEQLSYQFFAITFIMSYLSPSSFCHAGDTVDMF